MGPQTLFWQLRPLCYTQGPRIVPVRLQARSSEALQLWTLNPALQTVNPNIIPNLKTLIIKAPIS